MFIKLVAWPGLVRALASFAGTPKYYHRSSEGLVSTINQCKDGDYGSCLPTTDFRENLDVYLNFGVCETDVVEEMSASFLPGCKYRGQEWMDWSALCSVPRATGGHSDSTQVGRPSGLRRKRRKHPWYDYTVFCILLTSVIDMVDSIQCVHQRNRFSLIQILEPRM